VGRQSSGTVRAPNPNLVTKNLPRGKLLLIIFAVQMLNLPIPIFVFSLTLKTVQWCLFQQEVSRSPEDRSTLLRTSVTGF
jgi:hypothetical protein